MTQHVDSLLLGPYQTATGIVALPGSKSISNRTLLLAALSKGDTTVRRLLKSDDTDVMLAALAALGVKIANIGGDDYRVTGCGGHFANPEASLFLGNAGTAFRPLTAALAMQTGQRRYQLDGVPRMRERPIGDLVEGLRPLGAKIDYAGNVGFPPLVVEGRGDGDIEKVGVRGDVSSQFLSALLMALPLAGGGVTVEVLGDLISKPYVDITINLMNRFGVSVDREAWHAFSIPKGARYTSPGEVIVEGDASSASYFLAAGAISGHPVRVTGVGRGSIQGDVRFSEALEAMGADIRMGDDWIEASRPAGRQLTAIDADFNHIPDAAMTIAVLALFAQGTTRIRNIASWRVKETDRIAAMATELRKVGAEVVEGADFIQVTPPASGHLRSGVAIDTYDDHRMAMCFSLVSLGGVAVVINDPACVGKTFPGYFDAFRGVAV